MSIYLSDVAVRNNCKAVYIQGVNWNLNVFTCILAFGSSVRFSMWGLCGVQTEFPCWIYGLSFNKQVCSGNHARIDPTTCKKRSNSLHMSSQKSPWEALAGSSRPKIQVAPLKVPQEWFSSVPISHFWSQNGTKIYEKMKTKTGREKVTQNIKKCLKCWLKSRPNMESEIKRVRHAMIANFWRMSRTKY